MENIYQVCNRCDYGKLKKYPLKNQYINIAIIFSLIVTAYFFFSAATNIIADKLVDKEIKITDFRAKQAFISLIIMAIIMLPAYYFYNILGHLRAWFLKDCPHCESGYIIAQRTSNMQAIIYFLDLFFFQQILIPMYKTLTFQFLWQAKKKRAQSTLILAGKFVFYLSLFLGVIPFVMFLLGRDRLLGLIIAVCTMGYILGLIFFGNKEDRVYQKGTIFLVIPLYYVCMVEILRWAWFLSAKDMSYIPDQSVFLWMGVENLIRTQLFMDLFEVYDLGITNITTTTFITHSSIFITRLIIDIALIAMLIQMAIESYRRAWHFRFTGEKIEDVTEGEVLTDLENLAATGNPRNIHDLKENLDKVIGVIQNTKPYITSVLQIAHDEEDKKIAQECQEKLLKLELKEKEPQTHQEFHIGILQRILAIACVVLWMSSFSLGINSFIRNVIAHEIDLLMQTAEREQFKTDPIARQNFYLKAISKDSEYHLAFWKSLQTYLEMAQDNLNLLDSEEALNNIDKYLAQVAQLEKLPQYEKLYQQKMDNLQAEAYRMRGISFLLQDRIDLALGELERRKTQKNTRLIFDIMLVQISQNLFSSDAKSYFDKAYNELGFDPDHPSLVYADLLSTLHTGYNNNWTHTIVILDHLFEEQKIPENLQSYFSLYLAQACMRQGKKYFPKAEYYFKKALELSENDEGILGLSNTYSLQGKKDLSLQVFENKKPSSELDIPQAILHLANGNIAETLTKLKHIDNYPVRDSFKKGIKEYLQNKISAQDLEDMAYSWDVSLINKQKSLAYFYIALRSIQEEKWGIAANYLRHVIFLNESELREYSVAKLELENIQIKIERKSYQPELFFTKRYMENLNSLIHRELQKVISPEKKAIEGLQLIMESNYLENQIRAIKALTMKQIISPDNFLPFLEEAIQQGYADLTKAALEGFLVIGKSSYKARDLIAQQLENDREDIRALCVKIFSKWGQDAIPYLEKTLINNDYYIRRDGSYVFAQLGKVAATSLPSLTKLLDDPESIVVQAAFTAIKQIGFPENEETLINIALNQINELRLLGMIELEKHSDSFFAAHEQKVVPFLIETLLNNKDIQNKKWGAIHILMYKNKSMLNDPKIKDELKNKVEQSINSISLEEKLTSAIWLLNTYDLWSQSVEPAIETILSRWEIGDDPDQIRVINSILKNTSDIDKRILLAQKALTHKDSRIQNAGEIFVQKMILEDNLQAKAIINFVFTLLKNSQAKEYALNLLSFAIDNKEQFCISLFLEHLAQKNANKSKQIEKIIISKKRQFTATEEDLRTIISLLQEELVLAKVMCNICTHLKIINPQLLGYYSKLLSHNDVDMLHKTMKLISFYENKKEDIFGIYDLFAIRLQKNENKYNKETLDSLCNELFLFWGRLTDVATFYKISQKYKSLEYLFPSILVDIQVSSKISESEITPTLFLWMKSDNQNTILSSMRQLLRLKVWPNSAMTNMIDFVQSSNQEISDEAQRILLEMTSIYSVSDLKIWLDDKSPQIRIGALKAVAKMGNNAKELFPKVASLYLDANKDVQKSAIFAFSQIGSPAISYIQKALESDNDTEKLNAIDTFRSMEKENAALAISHLADYIKEKENKYTLPIFLALEKHTTIVFQPILFPALSKFQPSSQKVSVIYWKLMYILGERQKALENLTNLLENGNQDSIKILELLLELSPEYVSGYLKKALQQRYCQINIIEAMEQLKKIKDISTVIIVLEEIARDKNPIIREKAEKIISELKK